MNHFCVGDQGASLVTLMMKYSKIPSATEVIFFFKSIYFILEMCNYVNAHSLVTGSLQAVLLIRQLDKREIVILK